jgi:hypothetical protein
MSGADWQLAGIALQLACLAVQILLVMETQRRQNRKDNALRDAGWIVGSSGAEI